MRFPARGIGIVSLLVLAKIFKPENFGNVAKALLFKNVLELFTQLESGIKFYFGYINNETFRESITGCSLSSIFNGVSLSGTPKS
jgi:hypothetical protein